MQRKCCAWYDTRRWLHMINKRGETIPVTDAMGDETDILQQLLDAMQKDGGLTDEERHRLSLMSQYEMIRLIRKTQRNTIPAIFAREPLKATAVLVTGFILLHEFSTYVNIGIFLKWAAHALGIPTS